MSELIEANDELNHQMLMDTILRDYSNVMRVISFDICRRNTSEPLYSVIARVVYTDGSFGKLDCVFTANHERRY